MAGKVKVHHVGHLSPIFTAYVLESAQQLLLNGHLNLVTRNLQLCSQYPSKLLLIPGASQY